MSDWQWWASRNEEDFTVGPCDTKEQVIAEARDNFDGEPFQILEAIIEPAVFADWAGFSSLFEDAEERISDSDRVNPEIDEVVFDVTADQQEDLIGRLRMACHEWQVAHELTFPVNTFSQTRNKEIIT